jgi:hypothetical protein
VSFSVYGEDHVYVFWTNDTRFVFCYDKSVWKRAVNTLAAWDLAVGCCEGLVEEGGMNLYKSTSLMA